VIVAVDEATDEQHDVLSVTEALGGGRGCHGRMIRGRSSDGVTPELRFD
jgi:hypothetical protein